MGTAFIVIILISLFFFGLTFGQWISMFNLTGSNKFHFLSYFPFELNGFRRKTKQGKISILLLVICSLLFITPIILFAINFGYVSSYIIMIMFIIDYLVFVLLLFTKLSNFKGHLLLASSFTGIQIALDLLMFYYFSSIDRGYTVIKGVCIASIVAICLQLIFSVILIANKTSKSWAKMVKFDAEVFARPKYCYLAMLEWGIFVNLILSYIPIGLVLLF